MSAHVWFREVKCECGATTISNIVNTRYENTSTPYYWVSCKSCPYRVKISTDIIPDESLTVIRAISDQLYPRWPYTPSVNKALDVIGDVLSDINTRLEKLECK